ncbi:hypothetical protein ABPG74_010049 [Tetrahymena malaccensis]
MNNFFNYNRNGSGGQNLNQTIDNNIHQQILYQADDEPESQRNYQQYDNSYNGSYNNQLIQSQGDQLKTLEMQNLQQIKENETQNRTLQQNDATAKSALKKGKTTNEKKKKQKKKNEKKKNSKNSNDKSTQQVSDTLNSNADQKEAKATKFNAYEQQKALRKKFRLKQLEMKGYEAQSDQQQTKISFIKSLLSNNLYLRKSWRILLLFTFVTLMMIFALVFYYSFAFVRGTHTLGNNEQVVLNIESCSLMIYDFSLKSQLTLDVNFLSAGHNIPSSVGSDENIFIQYTYPDAALQGLRSTYSYSEDNGVKTFNFNNKLNSYECEIVLFVYKPTQFQSLNINCGDTNQCNIIIYSTQLSAASMNIKGINVQMNAPYLTADVFNYLSMKGTIEIPFFVFQTADVNTREGDISIQSTSDIDLKYTQKDPYNCISSKQITDNTNNVLNLQQYQSSIKFQSDVTQCQAIYPWGLPQDQQKADSVIEYRCYSNEVFLKNTGQRTSKLTASNSYGNIFVNVINAQGQHVAESSQNYQILFNKASKTDNQDNNKNIDYINISNLGQINLLNQTKEASNPKIYDPIFVFDIGPKFTRSATFQQIQFSYNPAYTYMKPYWLGELTLTLMTTQKYTGQYTLSPGFCPYIPALSLEKIHNAQYLITNFMQSNQAPQYSLTTNAWQPYQDYPAQKFNQNEIFSGFRDISLNRNLDEQWIGVDVDQSKIFTVTNYDVSYNSSLCAAIIVSCVLSGILGIVLLVILMFIINKNYIWVLNHIQSIHKYSQLEKGGAGEIDESTLDIHKRRFYLEYKEEQQMIEEQNKKAQQGAGENPETKEQGFVPKYSITSIFSLFYQLIYMSPPLSALIDYIVLLLQKAKQNSIREFYKLLFRAKKLKELKDNEDEEIHSLEKDQLLGNEMKQLYEKFCYLNQYLERKFDDEENLKFLTDLGFKIVARLDAQTQYFTYIKYNGTIPQIQEQPNKTSLDQFINSCCNLTKFDTDRIESSELDNYYQVIKNIIYSSNILFNFYFKSKEFCNMNHMQKLQLNEGALMRDYGISTIYLPQQWVERDERYDVQKLKVKYFIDKKRVENNFKILLAKDSFLFSMLYDTEDFKQAQKDIQAATGWQFFDLITVLAHILVMGLIGCPLMILAIFIRAQQSSYSLISPMRLIYLDTITYYPSSIPAKLMGDNWIVQGIAIITLMFWILSFLDLIYYYASMDFPQEKYFNKYKLGRGKIRNFFTGLMWIIVLLSFYSFAVYFSLVAIWLMLSAIINPNAFLPYATSAATFVTLVAKKYKDFEEISQNGFKIISDYLQEMAQGQFQELLKKMDIQDNLANLVPVDSLKDITAEASKLGIIDPATSENIQNNLEIMIRDPSTVTKLGQELIKISQDPHAFAQQMTQKLEEKAKAIIQQQVSTIDKDLSNELVNLIWCLLKNQKGELKNTVSSFVNALIDTFQKKQGNSSLKTIGFINLKGPIFDFIWEFAFPVDNFKGNYQDHLINIFCVALANIINVWNKDLKKIIVKKSNDNNENGNNKNLKSQFQKIDEQQLLKEKLMKDLERAESAIQAEDGQEEELEIELTSEEAINFAYKNIIFSAIQICRSIQSSNGEVILNQIFNLVQNGSKLPGFESLNQVKKYQDVFKIGYAIFKNDKEVDFEDVNNAFKCFLKNTGLEGKIKEIAGVGILDILKIVEVIIQSFKGQSKLTASSSIKKVIQSLIGSIKFADNKNKIRKKEIKQASEITTQEECLKMKEDVSQSLDETKATQSELEQQMLKAKQNEEYYVEKLQDSFDYLKLYLRELEQQKQQKLNKSIQSIEYSKAEDVINVLQNIIKEIQKIDENKSQQIMDEKTQLIQQFRKMKDQKDKEYRKLQEQEDKMVHLKNQIIEVLKYSKEQKESEINDIQQEISKFYNEIKTFENQIDKIDEEIQSQIGKNNQKQKQRKNKFDEDEDEDEYDDNDDDYDCVLSEEGGIQELNSTNIRRNNQRLLNNNEENETKMKEQINIIEYGSLNNQCEFQYDSEQIASGPVNKQVEEQIQQFQELFIQLQNLQQNYQNQQEIYDEIVNQISQNMMDQENKDYEIKQLNENKKYYLGDAEAYIEEYKACQRALNKVQQDKIDLHEQLEDELEKISYYEKYINSLDDQLQVLQGETREKNQNYEKDYNSQSGKGKKQNEQAQQKEDKDSLLSSGLTVMLNLFSGSISNLQSDLIKELGSFFKLVSEHEYIQNNNKIQKMFKFLHDLILDDSKGSLKNKGKEKLNNFLSLLSLIDVFLNDSTIAAGKITKNGKENLIESEVAKSLQIVFVSRFEGFVKQKAIDKYLKGSDLLELISKVMKLKEDVILGFMEILLGYKTSKDVYTFISFAAQLNKIKDNKVNAFIHLYNLYSSKNPSELFDALTFFKVTNNVSEQFVQITVKELVLVVLFMRESIDYSYVKTIFIDKLQLDIDKNEEYIAKVSEIKELIKKSTELPSQFKKIFEIEIKGYQQANTLYTDFKDINRNFEILLEQADFNFFKKFLSIRSIPLIEDPTQNTLVKSCITDISDMLNIDYQSVELFINLLTSSKSNKLKQALDSLQILKINPKSDQSDINSFVDFTSSILEKIEQKNQNITNISKNIFSDNLPNCLLRKILYHEGVSITYADSLELFDIYSNKKIPESIKNLLDFRYGMTGNRKRDIYKFLYPFQKEEIDKDYKNFKKSKLEQQGLIKAVQILSINEQSLRIQTFLQYLIKTKQDALLMTSCLLVYFSGRSSNIVLYIQDSNEKKQKKVSIEQLLCILLQVKQEFFEAIHTYFQEDTNYCTCTMIKFYRQLDYLQQQARGDENTILENNITVSDKSVEQYLRLINHLQFNTSFISKDTKISIEAVELVSNLMYIKYSKTEQERNTIFEQMKNNTYISKLFSQLGVNHQEFVTLVKIMYLDYEPTNVKWLSKSLKLPPQFKIDGLQQLIMLDQMVPVYGESSQNKKFLINLIKTNKFVKSFKIDTTWAEVAYILCKGDFCLLSKYQDKLIPLKYPTNIKLEDYIKDFYSNNNRQPQQKLTLTQAVNAKEIKYMSLVQGLAGLLSCRNSTFQTTEFLYQLYTYLSQKYVKDEQITIEDGLKKGNTLQYAIYKFTKSTFISPVWTLLMMGDLNTWEFLAQNYYLVNNCKNSYLNPILALVYVLNFRSNPLIVKQLLIDLEYAQRSYQIQIAKFKKDNYKRAEKEKDPNYVEQYQDSDEEIKEQISEDIKKKTKNQKQPNKDQEIKLTKEQQEKLQQLEQQIIKCKTQINELLKNSLEEEGENLFAIAEEINFPQKVIKMVLIYDYDNEQKKKNQNGKKQFDLEDEEDEDNDRLTYEQIRKAFEPLKKDLQKNENITEQILEFEILNGVFEQIATCFYTDPRKEKMDLSNEEKQFTNSYCLHTHSSSPLMQMIVLSTIAQLKQSYYGFYGFTERDEEHYKQVTFAIDLILGTLEKYFYFDDMMEFFPRHRLIPLMGLSVGFAIETDNILFSITSISIFGRFYRRKVISELCTKIYSELLKRDDQIKNGDDSKLTKEKLQKIIQLKKFNLKYKYFQEYIMDDLQQLFDQTYNTNSFFKGIYYEEVLTSLKDKNIYKLIDNYDELMWDSYDTDEMIFHMVDPKSFYTNYRRNQCIDRDTYDEIDINSGESNKKLFEYLDDYADVAESENFKFLIDIYKENYKSLNNHDDFTQNYGQDSNMFFGTLILNGIIYQIKDIKLEDFQHNLTSASLYMTSNKKALSEILSLLITCLQTTFSSLNELLNDSEENIQSFINLAMGKSINQSRDLEILLSKSLLSDTNKEVLNDCVWAYQGEMTEYLKLIQYSPLFQQSQDSIDKFTEFLYSFEKSQMHKNANNPYEINYFDLSNLSPNREKALEKAQQYLWKISQSLCYQKQLQEDQKNDPDSVKYSIESYIRKYIYRDNLKVEDNHMSQLLQKILYNDWNFLISKDKNILQDSFNMIFDIQKDVDCLEKLQILALIKPQKLGLKIQAENLNDLINFTKVSSMIVAGGDLFQRSIKECEELTKSQQLKSTPYNIINRNSSFLVKPQQEQQFNFIEAKYLHLLLSLSNNSLVHILNCLNTTEEEWSYDLKEEQEEEKLNRKFDDQNKQNTKYKDQEQEEQIYKFKEYNKLKNEALNGYRKKINQENSYLERKNKNISYILQSLYLWKNISHINWETILKNLDNFIEQPFQYKELKTQIDFLYSYIEYLSILPAIILDKNINDQNKSNFQQILQSIKLRNLDTDIFTSHIVYENNSIFMVYQSYENLIVSLAKKAQKYQYILQGEEEYIDYDENSFKETYFLKFVNCEGVYYLLCFLNGSFLKEIEKIHPLIEYLSNLYFKGLQAIHTQNPEPITKYLNECIDKKDSFINVILKENDKYAKIFNKVLDIIFTISFFTMKSSKISMDQKSNILDKVDQLLVDVAKDLLQVSEEIVNIVYAVFYLITNQKMKSNSKFKDKQACLVMLLKIAFENPDLSDFFFGSPKTGESLEQIDKMINTITQILQSILDRPSQSINDSDLVKEVLKLIKYASKGNIDVSIIEDVIAILTGDHQRVFNILKKFEIVDENKIALIQRAYNQVVDMPIFNQKDKAITAGGSQGQSDKIKEIVKKLQDGKANIKDVFIAVDAEGDNNGAISIDEFQSFVRRLGMELSRHRINEIFANIKNKKQKPSNLEKTDDLTLNAEEFEKAFKYVNDKKTSMSLEKLGVSPALLALALGTLIVILILLFVFIFLGIKAFAVGGTFGSIINSIIPMVAAGGAAGSQENKKDKLEEEEVSSAVTETQSIIHSENI